jgi:hypothetical protein
LPDGVVSGKKSKFGYTLERFLMEKFGIFYGHLHRVFYHLVAYMAIWFKACGHLVFFPVLVCFTKQNLATPLGNRCHGYLNGRRRARIVHRHLVQTFVGLIERKVSIYDHRKMEY